MKMFKEHEWYKSEAQIQKILQRYPHKSIMTAFCGFRCEDRETRSPRYYMLFPLATMNLNQYLATETLRPKNAAERLLNVAEMISVAEGLEWLAEKIDHRSRYGRITVIHHDLNPSNILVCEAQKGNSPGHVFKISDFGEAGFNFPDTEPIHDAVRSEVGMGDFAAPEASDDRYTPGPSFDVWSFACILYLVLSFNLDPGCNPYTARNHRSEGGTYRFFTEKLRPKGNKILSRYNDSNDDQYELHHVVKTGLEDLKKEGRNKPDSVITAGLCDLLQVKVFRIDPKGRPQIGEVVKDMVQVYRLRTGSQPVVLVRSLNNPKGRCAQSPNGRYEFFLDKNSLSVWNPQVSVPLVRTLEMSENFTFDSASCAEDAICYVEKNPQTRRQDTSTASYLHPSQKIRILTSELY